MKEPVDLTAMLVPAREIDPAEVRAAVLAGGYGDTWLRLHPLGDGIDLLQVELFDARGLPCIDPGLLLAVSGESSAATFVHVNHTADQAMVHAVVGGREVEGWMGKAGELDAPLRKAVGQGLAGLTGADDGSRVSIGYAASDTVALVRGRTLSVPPGIPTSLGSFGFHDRAREAEAAAAEGERAPGADESAASAPSADRTGEEPSADRTVEQPGAAPASEGVGDGGGDRVALVAFDEEGLRRSWSTLPGAELAARIRALPRRSLGPLFAAREEVVETLAALGDRTPEAAGLVSVRALELAMLSEAYLYSGGEEASFVDERLLPLFTLGGGGASMDGADEAAELERLPSVLAAMVDVLPFDSPEGSLLEQLGDDEVRPLAPWARPGEDYVGSVFRLNGERLTELLVGSGAPQLMARVEQFYGDWWRARGQEGDDDARAAWRRGLEERGEPDFRRVHLAWAEWRTVLAMAHWNSLGTALVFYG